MPLVDRGLQGNANLERGAEPGGSQSAERWPRVKALFLEAVQYSAPEQKAFLDLATAGDLDLRREVESLLASDARATSLWETPAAELLSNLSTEKTPLLLAPGTRLGAYEITEFIAAGGMGAVYRGKHTVLGREVAIKTVAGAFVDDDARRRLIREARHASQLTHPNICAIYDVGEAGGMPFIVLEYVSGKPLGALIRESAPPTGRAIDYAIQIAAALEHAHDRGLIHRDLKSSNVVIDSSDKAVVLDFGLAQRVSSASPAQGRESTLTNPHAIAGTLSHMAPEVLRGGRADARADIWALGVLMYEMFTRILPFTGRTPFETSSAILNDPPQPMGAGIPWAIRLIIEKCLIKDPRGRYQSAKDVRQILEAVRRHRGWPLIGRLMLTVRRRTLYGAAAGVAALALAAFIGARFGPLSSGQRQIQSIAVLPVENATGDSTASYYADGLTDALIAQLGAASDVRVFSRASIVRASMIGATPTDIAARLGANAILKSQFRLPDSNHIAVEASLVRVSDGRVLWSDSFVRDPREVLALEADVTRGAITSIRSALRRDVRDRLTSARAVNPEVYEVYLKGRYEWNKRTPSSLQVAIRDFSRAVELDPTYAPAHAALADCYNQLGTVMLGTGSPREYRPRAEAEAIKALQIDPSSAEAHAALGYVWHYDLRWADAEREFRRAIELNPSLALAHIWYANLLMSRSRMTEAITQAYAARELDPFSLVVNTNVGWVLFYAGRDEEAVAQLRQTLTLDSTYQQARARLIGALFALGRVDEAHLQSHRLVALSDSAPPYLAGLALDEARVGHRDTARVILSGLITRSKRQYVPPFSIGQILAWLGATDSAMDWVEKAFAERSNAMAYLAVEPANAPLRTNPRFQALLVRAGLK
jgi:serine/threonine-protein kinase